MLRKRAALLPVFAVGLLGLGLGLMLLSVKLHLPFSFMRPLSFVLDFTYFGRCVEFLLGIGLALWIRKRGHSPARRGTTLLGVLLISICLAGMVAASWKYQPTEAWPSSLGSTLINNFMVPIGVVVLFHGLMHEQTWLRRLLSTPLLELLGRSSYAFYLVHFGLLNDLLQQVTGRNIPLLFLLFNALSIGLYKFVEEPIHRTLLQRFRAQRTLEPALK